MPESHTVRPKPFGSPFWNSPSNIPLVNRTRAHLRRPGRAPAQPLRAPNLHSAQLRVGAGARTTR